jgi:hypothetical protein
MKSWKKVIALLVVAATGVFGAHQFMERRFCLEHICFSEAALNASALPAQVFHSSEEMSTLKVALDQPYTYLDRGKQSYAFISQDRCYVLKFFDFHRMQRRAAVEASQVDKREAIRLKRLNQLIHGYDVAYRFGREHTGLIFVQLNPNNQLDQRVTVRDRLGVRHRIPLKQVPFVVQRLAVPSRIEIASLLDVGDVDKTKLRFRQIIDMYLSDYKDGIFDADHNIMYNTGFAGDVPIRIDLGRLRKDEAVKDPLVYQNDLDKIVSQRIAGWLTRHYPRYQEDITDHLKGYINSLERGLLQGEGAAVEQDLVPISMHFR